MTRGPAQLSWLDPALPPIARRRDPATSHAAAEEVTGSGRRAEQTAACLDAVRRWPALTSHELAVHMGCSRYMPARRLPELRAIGAVRNGPIRECSITRRASLTWVIA